ncbi:MAG TPA: DinB family protein [Bacteroidia bacterium]|nr:DinB family protein [Bacteroidia bacterium]
MEIDEIKKSFDQTVDTWKSATEEYTEQLFELRPNEGGWSIGQVCEHLIGSTQRVFVVIDKCLAGKTNENEQKTVAGENAIKTNVLTNGKVQNPAHKENPPLQPDNRLTVREIFEDIRNNFMNVAEKVKASKATGKEKHPVLGFMNAHEWLHTIDMHWRHHIKQKENIDAFLKSFVAEHNNS